MNTTNTTIRVAWSVKFAVPRGKHLRAFGAAARAALETLVGWVCQTGRAAVGPMSRAQEANAAREYALKFSKTDPRFAADLCAAADRHEIGANA